MDTCVDLFRKVWTYETTQLCKVHTYRKNGRAHPDLLQIRAFLNGMIHQFNVGQKETILLPFTWSKTGEQANNNPTDAEIVNSDYWIFGYRFGSMNPTYKVAIICHLDTVPARPSAVWDPFSPIIETRDYPSGTVLTQPFLVGRGTIDDKGPAISALIVARAIAKKFDGSPLLDDVQIEVSFDSSEETDMSTPHYMDDPTTRIPNFGVVYDAAWNTRAEKGIERPKFTALAPSSPPPQNGLYLHSIQTAPENSINTVPDWAELEIRGSSNALERFSGMVKSIYEGFDFGDPDYRRAEMTVYTTDKGTLVLRAVVAGAQHGSAPDENRSGGANPLVSLSNFAAGLIKSGSIAIWGAPASICLFIASTWDTRVFGEAHSTLYQYDEVFTEGNGTTYAVTKTHMLGDKEDAIRAVQLHVDIRYAVPHHDCQWDPSERKEGFLEGDDSRFGSIFAELLTGFNAAYDALPEICVETESKCPPDIRWPDTNPNFRRVEKAYREVRGVNPPRYAIGGGTDAKGYNFLLAVGALFSTDMGPPVNYHGISEGAPIADMETSTKVLYRLMELEITEPRESPDKESFRLSRRRDCLKRIRRLRARGFTHRCECLG